MRRFQSLWVVVCTLSLFACQVPVIEVLPGESPSTFIPAEVSSLTETVTTVENSLLPTDINFPTISPQTEPIGNFQFSPYDCEQSACILRTPALFRRPIDLAFNDKIDATYPFGSNGGGMYEVHHGVEFVNPSGTEVVAVGDGIVLVAGKDLKTRFADWLNFYGNLVIIEHSPTELNQPVYSLYGHLSEIKVQKGQAIKAGDVLGLVGATGYAIGSHLHFEIRLGENAYVQTVNPVLWLESQVTDLDGTKGNLAGMVVDRWGDRVLDREITIDALQKDGSGRLRRFFINTYIDKSLSEVSPYGENFVLADLPAGDYKLSLYNGKMVEVTVSILPGKTTFIILRVP